MFRYRPPKSSVWGHLLRKMPADRAKKRFQEFLSTAVAEHKFSSASLMVQDASGQIVPRYERLIGMPAQNGCSFARLTLEQSDRCLDELIKDATSVVEADIKGFFGHRKTIEMVPAIRSATLTPT